MKASPFEKDGAFQFYFGRVAFPVGLDLVEPMSDARKGLKLMAETLYRLSLTGRHIDCWKYTLQEFNKSGSTRLCAYATASQRT